MDIQGVLHTESSYQTKKLGRKVGTQILSSGQSRKAKALSLTGELGGGKTTFIQGLAKGLGVKEKILSPTFVILKKFILPEDSGFNFFYHIDCYRIKNKEELIRLGLIKILKEPSNIVAVEWAGIIRDIFPKDAIKINFKISGKEKRDIKINE